VQKTAGKSRRCFKRVAKRVTEVEESALAGFSLVAADDGSLHPAAYRDCVLARRAAGKHLRGVRLQPCKELGIADQAVLDDFGIAGAKLAWRQCVEQRRIGEDEDRLIKGADQVLAMARIDRGLAAH